MNIPESVVIYTSASWEHWNWKNTALGGSELWAIYLSREFSKLGYKVFVFSDSIEESYDGNICWMDYKKFPEWNKTFYADYFISSRTEEPFQYGVHARKKFIQVHDIFLLSGKEVKFSHEINKYCYLSQWHHDFIKDYHNLPEEKLAKTSNGINLERFEKTVNKHPYKLHYQSSWDRGLDNILYLWPFLKKELPQLELNIYYGVHNWKEMCKQRNDLHGLETIKKLEELTKQPGIFVHGRKSQKEIAEALLSSSLVLYPTSFAETYYISGLEAQAAGVPIITNNYAGLRTTLGESALLLGNGDSFYPYTQEGRIQFFNKTIELLTNKETWLEWQKKGYENVKNKTWTHAALEWQKLFME